MKKVVLVTENYDAEAACSSLLIYDTLPDNVKARVDQALTDPHKGAEFDVYTDGLQSIYGPNSDKYFAKVGDVVEIIGMINFYANWR